MTWKTSPMEVCFHMRSHYRRIYNVKSVVDTSPPVGYGQLQSNRQSRPPSRTGTQKPNGKQSNSKPSSATNLEKIPNERWCYYRQNTLRRSQRNRKPESRSQSLPARPQTRRKPSDMPDPHKFANRARSTDPLTKRTGVQKFKSRGPSKSPPNYAYFVDSLQQPSPEIFIVDHPGQVNKATPDEKNKPIPAPRKRSKKRDTSYKTRVLESDYLRFCLRITEDIIRNDLYSPEDMQRVFNSHIEANRSRLDMDEMNKHIERLGNDLSADKTTVTKNQMQKAQQSAEASCICNPIAQPIGGETENCECGLVRCLPLECSQHFSKLMENKNTEDTATDTLSDVSTNEQMIKEVPFFESTLGYTTHGERFLETHYSENPENVLQGSSDSYRNELDDLTSLSGHITTSQGFKQLPSNLSCVTELTEPTTSSETLGSKCTTSKPNTSTFEFDDQDVVLPGFENLECNRHNNSVKSSSDSESFRKEPLHALSSTQSPGTTQKHTPSENKNSDSEKLEACSSLHESSYLCACSCKIPQQPSFTDSNDSLQYCEMCIRAMEIHPMSPENPKRTPREEQDKSVGSSTQPEEIKDTNQKEISLPSQEIKSPTACQNMRIISDSYSQNVMPQTESVSVQATESMKQLSGGCQKEAPQMKDATTSPSTSSEVIKAAKQGQPLTLVSASVNTDEIHPNDCNSTFYDSHFQVVEIVEPLNVKVRGVNNKEKELVLVPGCIYLPKTKYSDNVNSAAVTSLEEFIKNGASLLLKDANTSTDESSSLHELSCTSQKTSDTTCQSKQGHCNKSKKMSSSNNSKLKKQVPSVGAVQISSSKESGVTTDTGTYGELHQSALKSIHYSSFSSDVSHLSNIPNPVPLTESQFFSYYVCGQPKDSSIAGVPFTVDQNQNSIVSSLNGYENQQYPGSIRNIIEQLNDYDMTPQRDNNHDTKLLQVSYSKQHILSQNGIGKDNLLLGDEYEIKGATERRESSLSYNNSLPEAIRKFYPNKSTQTQSSDSLLASCSATSPRGKLSDNNFWHWTPKPVSDECFQNQESAAHSQDSLYNMQNQTIATQNHTSPEDFHESFKQMVTKELNRQSQTKSKLQLPSKELLIGCARASIKSIGNNKMAREQITPIGTNHQILNNNKVVKQEIITGKRSDSMVVKSSDNKVIKEQMAFNSSEGPANKVIGFHEQVSESEPIKIGLKEEEDEEDDGDDDDKYDMLRELDTKPSFVRNPSMLLTIEQVTNTLKKLRKNRLEEQDEEVLVEERQQVKTVTSNQVLSEPKQPRRKLTEDNIPFIEVAKESETEIKEPKELQREPETSTACCGLKKIKKKKRTTYLSSQELDVSAIPDEQLFVIDIRRPTGTGYDTDRKSLRFDYSAMKDFNKKADPSVGDLLRRQDSLFTDKSTLNLSPKVSEEPLPTPRKQVITYKETISPPRSETFTPHNPIVASNSSVVDILPQQRSPSVQSICMDTPEQPKKDAT